MSEREHFIATLHASFYGDKNAYDEVVRIYDELVEENKMLGKIVNKKDNIIKEVRDYANTDKNCIPKHIKDYINNLLDKEVNWL